MATARWIFTLERSGLAASIMPLAFAVFLAAVPRYGVHTGLLFGFLLLVVVGLSSVAVVAGRSAARDRRDGDGARLRHLARDVLFDQRLACGGGVHGRVCDLPCARAARRRPRRPSVFRLGARARLCGPSLLFVFPVIVGIEPATASPLVPFAGLFVVSRGDRVARARDESEAGCTLSPRFCRGGRGVVVGDDTWWPIAWALRSCSMRRSRCSTWECRSPGGAKAEMDPRWGGGALLIASLALLLFLAAGPQRRPRSGASRCCWRSSTPACSSRAPPAPCRCCRWSARCSRGSCSPCGGTTPRPPSGYARRCSCSSGSRSSCSAATPGRTRTHPRGPPGHRAALQLPPRRLSGAGRPVLPLRGRAELAVGGAAVAAFRRARRDDAGDHRRGAQRRDAGAASPAV